MTDTGKIKQPAPACKISRAAAIRVANSLPTMLQSMGVEPPLVPLPENLDQLDLPDLAGRIGREHEIAYRAAQSALDHAENCGRLLLAAKAKIGHGGWLQWIRANLVFRERQAQKYIRLARFLQAHPNAKVKSHLTIDGVLAAIAGAPAKHERAVSKPKWEPADPQSAPPEAAEQVETEVLPPSSGAESRELRDQYLSLSPGDRSTFARWILKDQIARSDLTSQQRAALPRASREMGRIRFVRGEGHDPLRAAGRVSWPAPGA